MALRSGSSRPLSDDDDDDFYKGGSSSGGETQRLLMREQDQQIASLASTVDRVQHMAVRVNEELTSQNKLLDELDDDVEKTDTRLRALNTRLRNLSQDKDRGKYCVICILSFVLFLLVWEVLS